jgi:hypothetical protein
MSATSIDGQTGGFFWSTNDCSENDKKVLLACRQGKYQVVEFMIMNDMVANYCTRDESSWTILHYIAHDSKHYGICKAAVSKILSRNDVTNFVNIQDKNGDTPLILSVKCGNLELSNRLVKAGADKNIRNNEKFYVCTETEGSQSPRRQQVHSPRLNFDVYNSKNSTSDDDDDSVDSALARKILTSFHVRANNTDTNTTASDRGAMPDTLSGPTEVQRTRSPTQTDNNTDHLLDLLLKTYGTQGQTVPQQGGNGNSVRQGQRKIKKTFDFGFGEAHGGKNYESESDSNNSEDVYASELSRFVKNQAGEILERVIKKISDIMNISEDDARIYKAALYKKVKDSKPELNNLDRAIEVEKLTTKEELAAVDFKKTKKEVEAARKMRESEREERGSSSKRKGHQEQTTTTSSSEEEEKPKKKSRKKKKKKEEKK